MAKAKKDGAKPSLRHKMTAAYQKMEKKRRGAIDRESANGCQKA